MVFLFMCFWIGIIRNVFENVRVMLIVSMIILLFRVL